MQRTKLRDRILPNYTRAEEIFNMVTHIVGGGIGVGVLVVCVIYSALFRDAWAVVSSCIYGASMIMLYTISSVYHGLKSPMAKKSFSGYRPLHNIFFNSRNIYAHCFMRDKKGCSSCRLGSFLGCLGSCRTCNNAYRY